MSKFLILLCLLTTIAAWGADTPPPLINGGGATLQSLAGSDKFVTVVLKNSGALDQNLKIVDVGTSSFSVMTTDKERTAYLFAGVKEIRVQDAKVETKRFNMEESRSLRVEEQRVVNRAFERAQEIFSAQGVDQSLKIKAATLVALDNRIDAVEYLRQLADSNDLGTQLDAAVCLYLTDNYQANPALVSKGLSSGNRKIKGKAALLAGLTKDTSCIDTLLTMLKDRAVEINAPAARALGMLNQRQAVPDLLQMLLELNPEKGDAAVYGLSRIGGPDVAQGAKSILARASGQNRYRIALLLYTLNDPSGKELMTKEMMQTPTLAPEAALILAKTSDWDSLQYLTTRLKSRYDETTDKLIFRARASVACIAGGDPTAVSYLQDLLRTNDTKVKLEVCRLLVDLGKRRMIPILQPMIEGTDGPVVLGACNAAVAMARPDFREKLLELWE